MKMLQSCVISAILLSGCVTTSSLPNTANEVSFDREVEGKTGWSQYETTLEVRGIDRTTAFHAAKAGLADANFVIKIADMKQGVVQGKHGMTATDWNIVAGVYFKNTEDGHIFKIIVEGSKDIGFWGDSTKESWPENISKGIREYILLESSISNTDKNIFN